MTDERPRILVVDDDRGIVRAVDRVLARSYEVRCTSRSPDAPRIAAEFQPDVAICDIQMPEMDGFELLDRLRETCPDIDVILMTGSLSGQDAHLIRALKERAYYFILKPFERAVLLTLVERCLETRRLRAVELAHLDRIERELAAARAFQRAMLPPGTAEVSGVRVDARCTPCGEVSGDLFDYREADGRLAFLVADVRGHGVPAALLTGTVKTAFRNGITRRQRPAAIATDLAQSLAAFSGDRFVTMFCGLYEPGARELCYVNAGHPAGLILGAGGTIALDSNAPLVSSAFPPGSWNDATTTLAPGTRLFLHTDGLFEPVAGRDRYPRDRLLALLEESRAGARTLDAVMADLDVFRGGEPAIDDVTMMLLEIGG